MVTDIQSAQIIRLKKLKDKIGLSRTAIYEKLNPKSPYYDPRFPRSIQIGPRARGFIESEVDTWLQHRIEQSRKA